MKCFLVQNGISLEITKLIQRISWSGSKGIAPRTLSITMVSHSQVDANPGNIMKMTNDDETLDLFTGLLYKTGLTHKKQVILTCYDNLRYWAKNKTTITFENKTASEVFTLLADKFEIEVGSVVDTTYKVPKTLFKQRSLYDIMLEMLSITWKQTGIRYYLKDVQGKATLVKRADQIHTWILEDGKNLLGYSTGKDATELYTSLVLRAENDGTKLKTIIQASDDLVNVFGIIQDDKNQSLGKGNFNKAQLEEAAKKIITDIGRIKNTFNLSTIGVDDVMSGDTVIVTINDLNINKAFYIDSDTHEIEGNNHIMTLQLVDTIEVT